MMQTPMLLKTPEVVIKWYTFSVSIFMMIG